MSKDNIFFPNTTQVPNFVFDVLMAKCGKAPTRFFVLLAIIRKTYGWQKHEDLLSLSHIIELTGMSKNAVKDALKFWQKEKVIKLLSKGDGRKISKYRCLLYDYMDTQRTSETPPEGQSVTPTESVNGTLEGQPMTPQKQLNQLSKTINKIEEEKASPPEKVFEKKKEESSFANQMLGLKDVVSSPVLNRNEAFQRMVNTISRIKKREKGQLVGYDSMNKNETANLYCLVDQFEGNENVVLQILETMLEYQNSGKLKLYSEILRTTTKHTNPNFWNQATISAFYIVKFASDKEVIDTAIRENEIYQEHLKRKKEQATFTKSPEAKLNIPIDTEFAKQLKELKDKPVEQVDELEVKRHADLEKMKSVLAATPKKSNFEIEREQEEKRKEILMKIELQKKVV
ncbi:MAG: replication protein [Leptospiraceae bacterium]|nr:replication protein [Leptospiraceae bacterium]